MKRCFVAFAVPDATRRALAEVQHALGLLKDPNARVRLVPVENLHVTLKFLGPTPHGVVSQLAAAIAEELALYSAIPTRVCGVYTFGHGRSMRSIYAGIAPGAGLDHVLNTAAAMDRACAAFGFEPEGRARVPHVTLARVQRARDPTPLTGWVAHSAGADYGAVDVGRVILYESVLNFGSTRYVPLETINLGNGTTS